MYGRLLNLLSKSIHLEPISGNVRESPGAPHAPTVEREQYDFGPIAIKSCQYLYNHLQLSRLFPLIYFYARDNRLKQFATAKNRNDVLTCPTCR